MTIDECVFALETLCDGDPERAHGEADEILLNYLRTHRAGAVAEAYNKARERVGFWYA